MLKTSLSYRKKTLLTGLLFFLFIFSYCQDSLIKTNPPKRENKIIGILKAKKDSIIPQINSGTSYSADDGSMTAVLPPVTEPAPNSSILSNLISENVDLYTGRTSVNLPIYNLKCGSIDLPISLQASANAHKVNSYGTWAGLGWNLNAGGMITRVMKSLPDEFTGTISSTFNINGYGYIKLLSQNQLDINSFESSSTNTKKEIINRGNWNSKNNLPDKGWDLQPDEFYYNFGNYSGKFVFDQNGKIFSIPQNNLKIIPSYEVRNGNNKISSFVVITEDGFQYEFGDFNLHAVEEISQKTVTESILYTYRAIHYGDPYNYNSPVEIDGLQYPAYNYFVYDRVPYIMGRQAPLTYINAGTTYIPETVLQDFDDPVNHDESFYCTYPATWYLTKITAPSNETIVFSYTDQGLTTYMANRSFDANVPELQVETISSVEYFVSIDAPIDLPGFKMKVLPDRCRIEANYTYIDLTSKRLSQIVTSQNNKIIFNATTPRVDFPNDNRLDEIIIQNSENQLLKKFNLYYSTTYNTEPIEDFTFYFQRPTYAYTNGTFVETFPSSSIVGGGGTLLPGIETRNFAIPEYARYRMFLTSVVEQSSQTILPEYIFEYFSEPLPYISSTKQDLFGFANNNVNRNPFINVEYTTFFPYGTPYSQTVPTSNPNHYPILWFNTSSGSTGQQKGDRSAYVDKMKAGVLKKITYPTGGYKIFNYEFNGSPSGWNGLRVNEIDEFESINATPIIKNYAFGPYRSADPLLYNHRMPDRVVVPFASPFFAATLHRSFFSSNRFVPETGTKGTAGGYDYVEISQPNNGKYRAEFTTNVTDFPNYQNIWNWTNVVSSCFTPEDQQLNYYFPFPQQTVLDWKHGLLTKESYFDQAGVPWKTIEYIYDFPVGYGETIIKALTVSKYHVFGPCAGYNGWNWMTYGKYYHNSAWITLAAKIEKTFDKNIVLMENKQDYGYTKYTYNNKDYVLPLWERRLANSKSEQMLERYRYPLDYLDANLTGTDEFVLGIKRLKEKNILNAKVEVYTYKQDQSGNNVRFTGAILNKFHSGNNVPVIKDVYKQRLSNPITSFQESSVSNGQFTYDVNYNQEYSITKVDGNGHVLDRSKTNDINESYLWGYDGMYAVAKATNALSDDIAFSSFEDNGVPSHFVFDQSDVVPNQGFMTGAKCLDLDFIFATPDPTKTYTISFWSKGSLPILTQGYGPSAIDLPLGNILKTIDGWNFYKVDLSNVAFIILHRNVGTSNSYLDEIRLCPQDAFMTTYTFKPLMGMTSETDPNGKITYYEYDDIGRLSAIRNENKDIIKTYCYNYANHRVSCSFSECVKPVITSYTVIQAGLPVPIYIYFTPSPNSNTCTIKYYNYQTGITEAETDICTSPRLIHVSQRNCTYRVTVVSYSNQNPSGCESDPVDIFVPQ